MHKIRSLLLVCLAVLSLASCDNPSRDLTAGSRSGWPARAVFDGAADVVPANASLGWRVATTQGVDDYVWIDGGGTDAKKYTQTDPATLTDDNFAGLVRLGGAGVLVHIRDSDSAAQNELIVCADVEKTLRCAKSADAKLVVATRDPQRTSGAVYFLSKDRRQRFVVPFDASMPGAPALAPTAFVQRSKESDAALEQMTRFLAAAATKDAAAMRALSVPERARDWDHFGILSSWQRNAAAQPKCIAANARGDTAILWLMPTTANDYPMLPIRVEMSNQGGVWLFKTAQF